MPAAPLAPTSVAPLVVGHVSVRLQGGDAARLAAVRALWERLFVLAAGPATAAGVTVRLSAARPALEPGEEVYAAAALQVVRTAAGFCLRCGASVFEVTPGAAARLYLEPAFWRHTPYEQREFFLLGLLMLLRPLGLYGLHACGLRRGDTGLLIVGSSGAGKTTTTLNLVRHGWGYLSDDAVLLRAFEGEEGGRVEALAFRRGFSCTPETLAALPGLQGSGGAEFGDPAGKRVVTLDAADAVFAPRCTPRLLLFPERHAGVTRLQPLPSAAALVRLSQQSAGIMTDRTVSRAQLELLKHLVAQARSYRLSLGEDALHDPGLVARLLEKL